MYINICICIYNMYAKIIMLNALNSFVKNIRLSIGSDETEMSQLDECNIQKKNYEIIQKKIIFIVFPIPRILNIFLTPWFTAYEFN